MRRVDYQQQRRTSEMDSILQEMDEPQRLSLPDPLPALSVDINEPEISESEEVTLITTTPPLSNSLEELGIDSSFFDFFNEPMHSPSSDLVTI